MSLYFHPRDYIPCLNTKNRPPRTNTLSLGIHTNVEIFAANGRQGSPTRKSTQLRLRYLDEAREEGDRIGGRLESPRLTPASDVVPSCEPSIILIVTLVHKTFER